MPRGLPDYGMPGYSGATVMTDNSDIWAAIASRARFDGLGRLALWNDYSQCMLNSTTFYTSGGCAAGLHYYEGDIDGIGVRLYVPAGSTTSYAAVSHVISVPEDGRIGYEFTFRPLGFDFYIKVQFFYYCEGGYFYREFHFDGTNHTIAIQDEDIAPLKIITDDAALFFGLAEQRIKMVVDGVTGKYVRVSMNQRTFDLTGYIPADAVTIFSGRLNVRLNMYGRVAGDTECILLSDAITTDEP